MSSAFQVVHFESESTLDCVAVILEKFVGRLGEDRSISRSQQLRDGAIEDIFGFSPEKCQVHSRLSNGKEDLPYDLHDRIIHILNLLALQAQFHDDIDTLCLLG